MFKSGDKVVIVDYNKFSFDDKKNIYLKEYRK